MGNTLKSGIDAEFINPFIKAAKVAFLTQASTDLVSGTPYIKPPDEEIRMEVAGVISLSNPSVSGSISLCFKREVFLKIYENMVGEKHSEISPEIEDAAGELLNIIFGQAKTILNDQKGYSLERAIPTIVVGERLRLKYSRHAPVILIPFECSAGLFHLVVVVEHT